MTDMQLDFDGNEIPWERARPPEAQSSAHEDVQQVRQVQVAGELRGGPQQMRLMPRGAAAPLPEARAGQARGEGEGVPQDGGAHPRPARAEGRRAREEARRDRGA